MSGPSIRLVVPYFGVRPSYLPLVVKSMAHNPDVHWLLLTEAPVPDAPPNVTVRLSKFTDLVARIQSHFDFEISLERPYKLCDFRPAFGEVFREELAGYDFWGHTDLDVVFGRIRDHLPPQAFDADKILIQGQLRPVPEHPRGRWLVPPRDRRDQLPAGLHQARSHALRRVGGNPVRPAGPGCLLLAGRRDLRSVVCQIPNPS